MQENLSTDANRNLICGVNSIMGHSSGNKTLKGSELGWRPVLELTS